MRVFIPEPNDRYGAYLRKVGAFGDIAFLADEPQNPFRGDLMGLYAKRLAELEFDPAQDILCMTGQNLVIAQALATAISLYPSVKVLMFDATVSDYRLKVLEAQVQS